MEPAARGLTVRPALTAERAALLAARWPGLPSYAATAEALQVAVSGRREILAGCLWQMFTGDGYQAGVSLAPGNRLADEAMESLIAGIAPRPGQEIHWTQWLAAGDPQAAALEQAGFIPQRRMMSYEIPNHPGIYTRLNRGLEVSRQRMNADGFKWSPLNQDNVGDVRLATIQEGLMSPREFDFYYNTGVFDPATSPVAYRRGKLAGFMILTEGAHFEIALMVIEESLRSSALGAFLLGEMLQRKMEKLPDWQSAVFRGDPEVNPGSRRLCLRFGGHEGIAHQKWMLPAAPL